MYKHNCLLYLICFYFIFFSCIGFVRADTVNRANTLLNKFCNAEFNGIEERFDFVQYSKNRNKKEEEKDPSLKGMVIQWDGDPIFVVGSFKILNVQVIKNEAIATVEYERLASTTGEGSASRKLIKDRIESDIVKINMIFDGNRWWVFDPPPPRISKDALIQFYKDRTDRIGNNWEKKLSLTKMQKLFFRNTFESYDILTNLPNGCSKD